ncbi:MAG: phage portal protein, partial [Phycisphaerae bacterium]
VEPVFDKRGGDLLRFDRSTDTGTDPVPTDDVLYIWQHDPDVEIGPPKSSAVEAAIMAATAARSTDSYVDTFFKRGAIKPSVFLMKGNIAPAEREKVRSWWRRLFRGSKSAWGENILNADTFDVKQVGEGLESLENGALTDKLREDIATALGVPHSILFSNAANFAVAEQDFRNLYTLTVAPLAAHMADVMNEQLFSRFNVTLEFNHDQMDIFQEDEEDRTASLINLLNAWASSDPDLTVTGMQMLGMELPAGVEWDEFRAALAGAREAQPPAAAENIPTATGTQPTNEETRALSDGFREIDDGRSLLRADLDKWFRKSLKRFRAGKGAAVNFESDHIDAPSAMLIHEFLSAAESSGDIARVFDVSV